MLVPVDAQVDQRPGLLVGDEKRSRMDWTLLTALCKTPFKGAHQRPILYRASLAEMVVPYGDPTAAHYRKNAFDVGEYGIGRMTNSLRLGCDCLGVIRYFDAVVNNMAGELVVIENGGGVTPPDIDPIITGLLARLPKAGAVWPEPERDLWLQLLKGSFQLIYKDKPKDDST